ncbi:hypothetical protein PYCCODRAFT_1224144 [Trametes coccinea BRFM310]|uniref:Uncharacterized protein n=1 Tax=Trametes coccinea (strain BRFM310) TaxID=1353009 RepID=A0A1Y2IYL6_TRAC3|nr:hypothetical protein PYCCODRAFT_1224144 [Trametes coccinea BRFM310]
MPSLTTSEHSMPSLARRRPSLTYLSSYSLLTYLAAWESRISPRLLSPGRHGLYGDGPLVLTLDSWSPTRRRPCRPSHKRVPGNCNRNRSLRFLRQAAAGRTDAGAAARVLQAAAASTYCTRWSCGCRTGCMGAVRYRCLSDQLSSDCEYARRDVGRRFAWPSARD